MQRLRTGFTAALLAGAGLTFGACDPTGPEYSTYRLESIDGAALPYAYGDGTGLEVVAGEFRVLPGHDIDGWIQLACPEVPASGSACELEGHGRIPQVGIFNGLENRFYPTGGGWFPMQLEAEEAVIQYGDAFEQHYQYVRVR